MIHGKGFYANRATTIVTDSQGNLLLPPAASAKTSGPGSLRPDVAFIHTVECKIIPIHEFAPVLILADIVIYYISTCHFA